MEHTAHILWHTKDKSWINKEKLFYIENQESLLVESIYSLISHGTERIVTTSQLSTKTAEKMSVPYMKGSLTDIFSYGYSMVGKVIEGSKEYVGRYVHFMHPHQDFSVVTEKDIFTIPDGIDLKTASLASNLETVINAFWDAGLELGDKVQVIGYGMIGALLSKLIKATPGVSLTIEESNKKRRELAGSHGHNAQETNNSIEYDVVFNTSAGDGSLQKALENTRLDGKVIELSWYGAKSTLLELGNDFHYGRKKIFSSQVSHIPFRKQPRWNYINRKELVFQLLLELDFSNLLTSEIPFSDTPGFYQNLRKDKISDLSTVIKYK